MEDTPEAKEPAIENIVKEPEPLIDIPKEELKIEEPKKEALLPPAPLILPVTPTTPPPEKKEVPTPSPFDKRILQKNDPLLLPTQRVTLIFKIFAASVVITLIGLIIFFFNKKESTLPVITDEFSPTELASLIWQEVAPRAPWQERDAPASFLFNGAMYIAGGIDGNDVTRRKSVEYWNAPHFNDIWKTKDGKDWERVTKQAEWSNRRSMSIAPFQDSLFMIGGWAPEGGYKKIGIWKSDDGIDWEQITETPDYPPREGQTVEIFNNKLFMMGGVNFDNRETLNDVWYSDNGVRWQQATTTVPWNTRYDHATVVYKDTLWLTAGRHLDGSASSDVWKSIDGSHWELVTENAPFGHRHGHTMVVYKGAMWVIGGWDTDLDTGFQSAWFSTDGKNWNKATLDTPWIGREDHSVIVHEDKIWIYAGMTTGYEWVNDVWSATLSTTTSTGN
jgi:hypothetical protein